MQKSIFFHCSQAHQNGLSDSTGKEFVHMLFRAAIEAFGSDPDIQVIISTGGKEDAHHKHQIWDD